jgi:hypothetical protein
VRRRIARPDQQHGRNGGESSSHYCVSSAR